MSARSKLSLLLFIFRHSLIVLRIVTVCMRVWHKPRLYGREKRFRAQHIRHRSRHTQFTCEPALTTYIIIVMAHTQYPVPTVCLHFIRRNANAPLSLCRFIPFSFFILLYCWVLGRISGVLAKPSGRQVEWKNRLLLHMPFGLWRKNKTGSKQTAKNMKTIRK